MSRRAAAARRQAGQVLIVVVSVVAVVSLAMVSFGMVVSLYVRDTRSQLGEAQALYITEAAVHRTIGYLQGVSNWSTAALPSPNPLSLTDATNQAVVSYLNQSKTQITVQSQGYVLARGYTLPASASPTPSKVLDHATIQVTLSKVPTSTLWGYALYANNKISTYGAQTHGSIFVKSSNFAYGTGAGVYNDFSYNSSLAPSYLQTYLNGLNAGALFASLKLFNGNITVSGSGVLGTAARPLNNVGLRSGKTVNVTKYFSRTVTVPAPGSYPTVSWTQVDYDNTDDGSNPDFAYIASDPSDPNDGCAWDSNQWPDQSDSMSLTLGGDVPNCTPFGTNGILWDPANNLLTVNGTNFIDGDLTIGDSTYPDINYAGRGLLVVYGNVYINAGLHPQNLTTMPNTNLLGIIAYGSTYINPPTTTPNKVVAGAFFSNGSAYIYSGTSLVGSVVAGSNVTAYGSTTIYQMPGLSANLPANMPTNGGTSFYVSIGNWKVLI